MSIGRPAILNAPSHRFRILILFLLLVFTGHSLPKGEEQADSTGASVDTVKTILKDYLWPTDASKRITSTFAEYRTTHFHGGIDISTNGQTGYKVFAVQDGYVYRVHILMDGYGKMLFIKHTDGYISTFAHLQSFNDEIEKAVKAKQLENGSYTLDYLFEPGQIKVKRGDVIAFTGHTGVGPPHLHFELRDENMNLVNPLLCSSYSMVDNIPPTIKRMMIEPLGANSLVENSALPRFFSRFPGKNHDYHVPQPIKVEGEIGFGIDAIDRSDNSATSSGIHRTEFYIDDSLIYAMQMDRVPNDEAKEIDLQYDMSSVVEGKGRFQKLYVDEGNNLPFYGALPVGAGVVSTNMYADGVHDYRIACYDYANNRTQLSGKLAIAHRPDLHISEVTEDQVKLTGTLLTNLSKCYVYGRKVYETQWAQHTLTPDRFEVQGDTVLLPANSRAYDVLKIVAETKSGAKTLPMYYFKKKHREGSTAAYLKVDPFNDYTRVTLTCAGMFTAPPEVFLKEGVKSTPINLESEDVDKYIGSFSPSSDFEGTRQIEADVEVNGEKKLLTQAVDIFVVPTDKAGSFSYNLGEMLMSYDSGAVYKPLYMRISRTYENGQPVYELQPQDVLLNKGIRVSLPAPANAAAKKYGIYTRTSRGLSFQTDSLDGDRAYYTATFSRTLGEASVMHDDQPPSIGRLRVSSVKGRPLISFIYHDNLSGVDPREIKMTIDGNPVIAQLEGMHTRAWWLADTLLARGKHHAVITLKDRAKNEISLERLFSTK
jgi:murein DD-endopeptidase MepM/ murein hydrolase activator NlpD